MENIALQKKELRQIFRQKRKNLSKTQQIVAAIKLYHFLRHNVLNNVTNKRIALYVSTQSELNLSKVARLLKRQNNQIFLPIVEKMEAPLIFRTAPVSNWSLLPKKHFNIPAPQHRRNYFASQLDIIFTPLLAFDQTTNRLGMGGGFYDRTLAQIAPKRKLSYPVVIGIGYDCQQHQGILPTDKNDCKLQAIATPSRLLIS